METIEEEKFLKRKSKEQKLKEAIESLEESLKNVEEFRFNFACFIDSFKRSLEDGIN